MRRLGRISVKVLACSAYYKPEVAANIYLLNDIYEGMIHAGHTLEVYAPVPVRGVSREVHNKYKHKKLESEYDGRLRIHRIAMYRESKSYILRAVRYFLVDMAFIWKGLQTEADVIFVQSTPPTQGMMAGILGMIKHIPVIYNLQDIFPESLVNARMTKKGSMLWKIGRLVENFSYRHAEKIIVISEDFKRNIMAKGVPEEKIAVVPNWADVSSIYPVAREDNVLIRRYHLSPEKFYITYCGNVGHTQNIDLLLETAKELSAQENLSFVIIGDGADQERIQKRVQDERIGNVILLPFQPYEDIAHVFSLGDVGLIISKPGVGNNSVPSKTWNIMAAGKPVLASFDLNSELCRLIDAAGCGICADDFTVDALCRAIKKLIGKKQMLAEMGKKGFDYLSRNMDRDKAVAQYIAQLQLIFQRL